MSIPKLAAPQRPLPSPDLDDAPFWEGLKQHKLLLQRCAECKLWRHPPMPMCPACNSFEQEWIESPGRGTVYSWIIVRQHTHPFFSDMPYNVVLVELDEGVRIFSNLLDVAPEDIQSGMTVQVEFLDLGPEDENATLTQFRVVGA
jgi:uncharacterized OB-fold protein